MTETRKLRVFLCHSSQDKPIVRELYQRLNAEGWIDPWLDEEKLLPGQDWDMEIEKAVETADSVIVFLSNNSVTKEGYVQKELRYVIDIALEKPEGTIYIVPIRLNNCPLPRKLREYHYIDYFPFEIKDRAEKKLFDSLRLRRNEIDPDSIPPEVDEWLSTVLKNTKPVNFAPTPLVVSRRIYRRFHHAADMEFAEISAGGFIMGTDDEKDASSDERPQHIFLISYDYFIARFPVTNLQYLKFAQSTDIPFHVSQDKIAHPVIGITLVDAIKYCDWLNYNYRNDIPENYVYRLPTEAEWEKAARGVNARNWPWGEKFDKSKCNSSESGNRDTTPVDKYSPQGDSSFGVADMAGNVWEWTQSISKSYPYAHNDGRENIKKKGNRTLRGGSFNMDQNKVRTTFRLNHKDTPNFHVGIRVVVAPPIK